ncbi:hypothetical protein, partial [Escherichia coli]
NGAFFPALISSCNYAIARINIVGITGSTSAPYVAFGCNAGILIIRSLKASGSSAAYLGYAGGSSQVILPSAMSADITLVRKGSGSSADIRQESSSLYNNIQS